MSDTPPRWWPVARWVFVVLLFGLLLLVGCARGEGSTGSTGSDGFADGDERGEFTSTRYGNLQALYVDVPGGQTVLCVVLEGWDGSGITCDWAKDYMAEDGYDV